MKIQLKKKLRVALVCSVLITTRNCRRLDIGDFVTLSILAIMLMPAIVQGQDLRIGTSGDVSSIDPMFHYTQPNDDIARHIFDQLIFRNADFKLKPALALSWRTLSDTLWEIKLRANVKFHDGSPFTAEDVIFSIDRADKVPGSPASYALYTKTIKSVTAANPLTIQIETLTPHPLLPWDLSIIHIQSSKAAANKSTRNFNSGDAAIGTGPYKYVEWIPGRHVRLERNDLYWGGKPEWDTVTVLPKTNNSARVAALMSGDVDLINGVPPTDIDRLANYPGIQLATTPTIYVMYLQIDHREQAPYVFDNAGYRLKSNPLKDRRVRQAISKAINRSLIVKKIMHNQGVPAGQLLPPHIDGVASGILVDEFEPERARNLLTQAGYPQGFRLTLHASNNRYLNADRVAQAIAQMLTRVGVKVDVQLQPHSVFRSRGRKLELSFQWGGWGSENNASVIRSLLMTRNPELGYGAVNRGLYSNAMVDGLVIKALRTMDSDKHTKLLQEAMRVAMNDLAVIPVYYEVATWGTSGNIEYAASTAQETLARNAHRVSQ